MGDEQFSYSDWLSAKFSADKPAFDNTGSGRAVNAERSDQPGDEHGWEDVTADDFHSQSGQPMTAKTTEPTYMREDQGWRPEAQQSDAGKVYTRAEIDTLYPSGYVPGAPSIHKTEEATYRIPESRPRRICG